MFKAVDVAVLTFFTLESMDQRTLKWYWADEFVYEHFVELMNKGARSPAPLKGAEPGQGHKSDVERMSHEIERSFVDHL